MSASLPANGTPAEWSGRRSGRVESPPANTEVGRAKADGKAPGSMAPRTSRGASPERRPGRVSGRRLQRLDRDLSARERALLHSLAGCRFMATEHVQRLHFADHQADGAASRVCRRVLTRLDRLGVIEHLERRIGGIRAGSASYVWRVGPVGDRLLRSGTEDAPRARRKQPSLRLLDHTLAVCECYVQLVELARRGQIELLRHATEPGCWRPYLGLHGEPAVLKPDLYAVTASAEFEDSWFIEVDRGTESLPTLLRKCAQYEQYRRTGREQHERGVFPAVLWLMPDERRVQALTAAIRRSYGPEQELFRVVTANCFAAVITGEPCTQTPTTNRKEVT